MSEASGFPFTLDDFRHGNSRLLPMRTDWANCFGESLARIDPWLSLGYSSQALCRYLSAAGQERHAMAVLAGDTPAACLTVRPNWLRGPFLELLAVLPEFQGCGLGREIIAWLVGQTKREGHGNLWTICSEFNLSAQAFYRSQGFQVVGCLPDLISSEETEILLRLRLKRS